jgi:hypothetical protein
MREIFGGPMLLTGVAMLVFYWVTIAVNCFTKQDLSSVLYKQAAFIGLCFLGTIAASIFKISRDR